jgi:hypothetical protein
MNLDELVAAAQKRLLEWINRSAGQHKRAIVKKHAFL